MKHLILILLLATGSVASAQHLDGAWLTDTYGAPGDAVIEEVKAQIIAYTDAKAEAEGIQRGEAQGDLRAAQQKCVDTALYSWVKACYLAEMGRLSALAGNKEQAIKDYEAAMGAAQVAMSVDTKEERTNAKSKEQGGIIAAICAKALPRLRKP